MSVSRLQISENEVSHFLGSGPRYTSYPTQPVWTPDIKKKDWINALQSLSNKKGLSLYLHLPFCEKLCHFCACNRIIDPKHSQEARYLLFLEQEIDSIAKQIPALKVHQIHWGGGTPTFLKPQQIQKVFSFFKKNFDIDKNAEISIELHPNVTHQEHLQVLTDLGFNRLSIGVQDLDPIVQDVINRHQTFEKTFSVIQQARHLHFKSINLDLVYGLPKQNQRGFSKTIEQVLQMRPERIALYSYANVPWRHAFQRRFEDSDLPEGLEKLELYLTARQQLESAGYHAIGMDHFALEDDPLFLAHQAKSLHRNFMGYTTQPDLELLGFGISAISEANHFYIQNEKKLGDYYRQLKEKHLPIKLGHRLNAEDLLRKKVILELMCFRDLDFEKIGQEHHIEFQKHFQDELKQIEHLQSLGLLSLDAKSIRLSQRGKMFVRNISMVFDQYLPHQNLKQSFSKTI